MTFTLADTKADTAVDVDVDALGTRFGHAGRELCERV